MMTRTRKNTNIFTRMLIGLVALAMLIPLGLKVCHADSNSYTVKVDKGYLALRTATAYDEKNEIGELYTGDSVSLIEKSTNTYWLVYSSKYNKQGYVNKNYLVQNSSSSVPTGTYKTVHVNSGYLALRNDMAYDDSNIIKELYNGDKVLVLGNGNGTYWYVSDAATGRNGYVNCNYLV